jgi:hypothetical protein
MVKYAVFMIFVSIPVVPGPDWVGAIVGTGMEAGPEYAVFSARLPPVLASWDIEDRPVLVLCNPVHPAAATIATHTTRSAMIL